ncbi:chromate transporter [Alphaproteobacteria bacterium 46_93_T64]|nr:chromate transporter [Alphaproteobacteria bacterium 46_93_T64]
MENIGTLQVEKAEAQPHLLQSFRVWAMIGLLSFGGPAAQISLMHRVIVEEKKWLSEKQYLNALSFCMLLPGPEAMQLATYVGWRLHGVAGGLMAGLLFVIPGAIVVLSLAMIYAAFGQVPIIETLFFGIKAAVLVIVIEALLRVSRKALHSKEHWLIAGVSFVAIFFLGLPFPVIVLMAALYGFVRLSQENTDDDPVAARPKLSRTLRTTLLWSAIWLVPIIALSNATGSNQILSDLGWFFSKLAVVTFGGAYAVLAYMGQDVVVTNGWLNAGQMMDGLGLAETTPGPLILVTEFVGYLSAYQHDNGNSFVMGLMGAMVALWATFAPCFMWIFAGAPYIEWINSQPRLKGALSGITAAVVGVILNLSVWFAVHVFFEEVALEQRGILQLWVPDLASLDWSVVIVSLISGVLLLRLHWKIPTVLCMAAATAFILKSIY